MAMTMHLDIVSAEKSLFSVYGIARSSRFTAIWLAACRAAPSGTANRPPRRGKPIGRITHVVVAIQTVNVKFFGVGGGGNRHRHGKKR